MENSWIYLLVTTLKLFLGSLSAPRSIYDTQSFAFGAYQIRIATCLYSMSYLFPFLVVPMGIANFHSNFLGGMGIMDILGGASVGILTSGGVYLLRGLLAGSIVSLIVFVLGLENYAGLSTPNL